MATERFGVAMAVGVTLLALAGCDSDGGGQVGGVFIGGGSGGVGGGIGVGTGVGTGTGLVLGAGSGGVSYGLGLQGAGSSSALDRILAEDAARRALEHERSGTTTRWHNPDNGHTGAFTPLDTYRSGNGLDCRNFQHEITIGGRTETTRGAACRTADGGWRDVTSR